MLAMCLWRSTTFMAPLQQQRRRRAGVLHAVLLLLFLALLMHASVSSAFARPVPSEIDGAYRSEVDRQAEGGGIGSQEVYPMENAARPHRDANEDNLKECGSVVDSTTRPCVDNIDRRMLDEDYGPPGRNQDTHPVGPLP